jgi:signal transduction histidine kinase
LPELVYASEAAAAQPSRVVGRLARARVRYVFGIALLATAYYCTAKISYELEFAGPVAAIVWLPVGVAIAFLCVGGLRFWPGVLIGDLLANNYSTLPLGSAIGQTLGNMLEVLVSAWLIRRLMQRGSPLDTVDDLARMLAALVAGTAISAIVGPVSLRLGNVITTHALPDVWRTWWLGDLCGAIVVVPLVLAWYRPPPRTSWTKRAVEGVFMLTAVAVLCELALRTHRPLTYLVFPALIWAALRFGQRGATLAVAAAVGFTVWNTAHYSGPFAFQSITRSVLYTQLFIAVAALSTLSLAAVVSERELIARRLSASRARLVGAADTERRRLERNLHDGAQQRLTTLAVQLHRAARSAQQTPEQAERLAEAETDLQLAIDDLRELGHGIHPVVLTDFGLGEAIRSIAARSTVPITLLELPSVRLNDTAEATAYYVFSEAVANAQKYARASAMHVRSTLQRGLLHIEVVDNGIGGATEGLGSGLQGLRDRVEATGGTFRLVSPIGRGTKISAAIPAQPR